jgi:hypothetical protein
MNRRIMQSLKEWKHKPFKLHFCSKGKVLRNVYDTRQFRTIPGLLEKQNKGDADVKTLAIFQRAAERRLPVECSLFERHALEHVVDAKYALHLEQDFADAAAAANEDADGLDGASGETKAGDRKGANSLTQAAIRAALLKAVQGDKGAAPDAVAAGSAAVYMGSADNAALAKGLGSSLQDLMQAITDDFSSGKQSAYLVLFRGAWVYSYTPESSVFSSSQRWAPSTVSRPGTAAPASPTPWVSLSSRHCSLCLAADTLVPEASPAAEVLILQNLSDLCPCFTSYSPVQSSARRTRRPPRWQPR